MPLPLATAGHPSGIRASNGEASPLQEHQNLHHPATGGCLGRAQDFRGLGAKGDDRGPASSSPLCCVLRCCCIFRYNKYPDATLAGPCRELPICSNPCAELPTPTVISPRSLHCRRRAFVPTALFKFHRLSLGVRHQPKVRDHTSDASAGQVELKLPATSTDRPT
jgi:hypothetical protein